MIHSEKTTDCISIQYYWGFLGVILGSESEKVNDCGGLGPHALGAIGFPACARWGLDVCSVLPVCSALVIRSALSVRSVVNVRTWVVVCSVVYVRSVVDMRSVVD